MITRIFWTVPLVVAGWIAVLAGTMLLSNDAPGAFVLFPAADFVTRLPDGVAILSHNAISITVSGKGEGLTRALYEAGGALILPAGLAGCFG